MAPALAGANFRQGWDSAAAADARKSHQDHDAADRAQLAREQPDYRSAQLHPEGE